MKNQQEVIADPKLVAACGLYCGACRSYLRGKCPGCLENIKATWCKLRTCCLEHHYQSCSDCTLTAPADCKKFNNFISKIFGLLFNSDRSACIARIKETGYEAYAAEMAAKKKQTINRK